jgi:hypothetical protein
MALQATANRCINSAPTLSCESIRPNAGSLLRLASFDLCTEFLEGLEAGFRDLGSPATFTCTSDGYLAVKGDCATLGNAIRVARERGKRIPSDSAPNFERVCTIVATDYGKRAKFYFNKDSDLLHFQDVAFSTDLVPSFKKELENLLRDRLSITDESRLQMTDFSIDHGAVTLVASAPSRSSGRTSDSLVKQLGLLVASTTPFRFTYRSSTLTSEGKRSAPSGPSESSSKANAGGKFEPWAVFLTVSVLLLALTATMIVVRWRREKLARAWEGSRGMVLQTAIWAMNHEAAEESKGSSTALQSHRAADYTISRADVTDITITFAQMHGLMNGNIFRAYLQRLEAAQSGPQQVAADYAEATLAVPSKSPLNEGYIDGYFRAQEFFVTRAPNEATSRVFWEAVWQSGTTTMAIICDEPTSYSDTNFIYWPNIGEGVSSMAGDFGSVRVVTLDESLVSGTNVCRRRFQVKHKASGKVREIVQIELVPHYDAENPSNLTDFTVYFVAYREAHLEQGGTGPILIHGCNNACRVAMSILFDICVHSALDTGYIDAIKVKDLLSEQYPEFFKHDGQFRFIFMALSTLLLSRTSNHGARSENEHFVADVVRRWKRLLEMAPRGKRDTALSHPRMRIPMEPYTSPDTPPVVRRVAPSLKPELLQVQHSQPLRTDSPPPSKQSPESPLATDPGQLVLLDLDENEQLGVRLEGNRGDGQPLLIIEVNPNGASAGKLAPGDLVFEINQQSTCGISVSDFEKLVGKSRSIELRKNIPMKKSTICIGRPDMVTSFGFGISGKQGSGLQMVATVALAGPAARKGVMVGDVIAELNGFSTNKLNHDQIVAAISSNLVVRIGVLRPARILTTKLNVLLDRTITKESYGFTLAEDVCRGKFVASVVAGGLSHKAGLLVGDSIVEIDGTRLSKLPHDAVVEVIAGSAKMSLHILRTSVATRSEIVFQVPSSNQYLLPPVDQSSDKGLAGLVALDVSIPKSSDYRWPPADTSVEDEYEALVLPLVGALELDVLELSSPDSNINQLKPKILEIHSLALGETSSLGKVKSPANETAEHRDAYTHKLSNISQRGPTRHASVKGGQLSESVPTPPLRHATLQGGQSAESTPAVRLAYVDVAEAKAQQFMFESRPAQKGREAFANAAEQNEQRVKQIEARETTRLAAAATAMKLTLSEKKKEDTRLLFAKQEAAKRTATAALADKSVRSLLETAARNEKIGMSKSAWKSAFSARASAFK